MRGLRPLEGELGNLLRELGFEVKIDEQSAMAKWAETVGPHLARHSRAIRVRRGVLWIASDSSAWSQEISMRREDLRNRLNRIVGRDVVTEIRLVVEEGSASEPAPVHVEDWRPYKSSPPGEEREYEVVMGGLAKAIEKAKRKRGADV